MGSIFVDTITLAYFLSQHRSCIEVIQILSYLTFYMPRRRTSEYPLESQFNDFLKLFLDSEYFNCE
jgi:hypothetical protein